ncbi:hypothetical protein WMY93_010436 [Mugilogobius chulae]|uniref:Uncharacterized protein n=1 Tax=Mugilogobius chulae TaxID=88201 RepID=A0AAW0PAZ7_9GOBI
MAEDVAVAMLKALFSDVEALYSMCTPLAPFNVFVPCFIMLGQCVSIHARNQTPRATSLSRDRRSEKTLSGWTSLDDNTFSRPSATKMYYKFSGFTQKLTGAAPATAYSPQGLKPGLAAEPPTMIFATPTKVVSESGAVVEYLGGNKVPDMQRIFQRTDGRPVHLKGGYADKLLYRTTMALTVGGALYVMMALYMAAQPKKN